MWRFSLEIERRFLLEESKIPEDAFKSPSSEIRQGYLILSEKSEELRVRQKGSAFFLTVKKGAGLQRSELEVEITAEQFEVLWAETSSARIEKTRYKIPYQNLTLELDRYHGALEGLFSIESEFESVEQARAFDVPEWFGAEVTEREDLRNAALALQGLPDDFAALCRGEA